MSLNVLTDDDEFLTYCWNHSYTPRCGFVFEQLERLAALADVPLSYVAGPIIDAKPTWVRDAVMQARRFVRLRRMILHYAQGPLEHYLDCNSCTAYLLKMIQLQWAHEL